MIGELGSPGGAQETATRFRPLNEMIFRDFENRTEMPEGWAELSTQGVADILAHESDKIGHTRQEVATFRDRVLVELLALHGKI